MLAHPCGVLLFLATALTTGDPGLAEDPGERATTVAARLDARLQEDAKEQTDPTCRDVLDFYQTPGAAMRSMRERREWRPFLAMIPTDDPLVAAPFLEIAVQQKPMRLSPETEELLDSHPTEALSAAIRLTQHGFSRTARMAADVLMQRRDRLTAEHWKRILSGREYVVRHRGRYPAGIDARARGYSMIPLGYVFLPPQEAKLLHTETRVYFDGRPKYPRGTKGLGWRADDGYIGLGDLPVGRHTLELKTTYEFRLGDVAATGVNTSAEYHVEITAADTPDHLAADLDDSLIAQIEAAVAVGSRDEAREFTYSRPASDKKFEPVAKVVVPVIKVIQPLPVSLCMRPEIYVDGEDEPLTRVAWTVPAGTTATRVLENWVGDSRLLRLLREKADPQGRLPARLVLRPSREEALSDPAIEKYYPRVVERQIAFRWSSLDAGGSPSKSAADSAVRAADRPNVLLLCIDDLRPVLGCCGGAAKTPHLDRFARSAVTFQRHYVQFPSCGPSRACMLGGVRPDSLRLYGNGGAGCVADHPDTRPTLPLHFRNHGYQTLSFGKTYHGKGAGEGFGWSQPPWHPPSGWTCYVDFQYAGKGKWRPAFEIYDGPDRLHSDYQTADQAIAALEQNRDQPFFIAAGFYKPHLPFVAPKRYWDLYRHDEIQLVGPPNVPEGANRYGYAFREICSYGYQDGDRRKTFTPDSPPTPSQARDLIHAYYAAVSFIDAQVGRILQRLEELGLRETTAVVVWSDHGFHLGDQARWAKWTQFESDMRSPLMIRLPGIDRQSRNTSAIVEEVDVYPTLADYCRIGLPDHLAGRSLLPLIQGKTGQVKKTAFSQVRGLQQNSHLMAYSMRTPRYRYVQWRDTSDSYRLVDQELYDLGEIGSETRNIAEAPGSRSLVDRFRRLAAGGYETLRERAAAR